MYWLIKWIGTIILLLFIFSFNNIFAATTAQIYITVTVIQPKILLEKGGHITLSGEESMPVPGATITYSIIYDNDGAGVATDLEIFNDIPDHVTYVIDSAEDYNSPHSGKIEVEYKDKDGNWHPSDFDNANPLEVKGIKWMILEEISPDDGDPEDSVQDEYPAPGDKDAGTVRYKVTID
ncbi:MAG: hypothetical protein QME40_07355 [bacterium]|nr:hypothetical protein [bacterium]